MTTGSIVFMVVVMAVVWGGFAYCLVKLAKQKGELEDPDS